MSAEQPLFLGRSDDPDASSDSAFPPLLDVAMDAPAPSSIDPNLDLDLPENIDAEGEDDQRPQSPSAAVPVSSDSGAPPQFAPSSQDDLPPDSNLVASLPVYLSSSLLDTSSLHLFQYPIFPRERPLPVPFSAASRGLKVFSRWRPKSNRVEVDLPLDVREEVYNMDKGTDFGAGADLVAQKQAKIDAAYQGAMASGSASGGGAASGRVKKEKLEEERSRENQRTGPKRLDKTRLDSVEVPKMTNYMVGVIRDRSLHLTPLSSVVQLRPSMHYLDALDEARETEKRRDRAAAAGEAVTSSEDEEELADVEASGAGSRSKKAPKKDEKKPTAQTLSVAMRGDPNAPKGGPGAGGGTEGRDHLMAAQREADAERWIDMEWRDEHSIEAVEAFQTQLFAGSKKRLMCETKPREYLVEVEP